jgi:ABC-type multidrug transport system fused ATPase/permease subunit
LFKYLGWSALVGLGVLIIFSFVTPQLMGLITTFQTKVMERMDMRITGISEVILFLYFRPLRSKAILQVLNSIRIIKFFAWEAIFKNKVNALRSAELGALRNLFATDLAMEGAMGLMPIAITLSSFAVYIKVFGYELDAAIAFTSLSLFNLISGAVDTIVYMTKTATDCRVSFLRISGYMEGKEIEDYLSVKRDVNNNYVVGFEKSSLSWDDGYKDDEHLVLKDLDVIFPNGKVTVIMGATASGKSSLLLGLLGELSLAKGKVYFPFSVKSGTSVSYVAQQAWIQNATIRDNILFGKPYDPILYKQTIEACALKRDFEILDGGDMTEIGEKGINVSGGQKQRIALARAVYSQSDIILLDDPLSAVDAPTAKHLFEKAILGPLLKGKTVLLVTHAVGLTFKRADYALILKSGRVVVQGSPEEVEERLQHVEGGESLLGEQSLATEEEDTIEVDPLAGDATAASSVTAKDDEEEVSDKKEAKKLITEEGRAMGVLSFSVYKNYVKAIKSPFIVGMYFLIAIAYRIIFVGKDLWLAKWSRSSDDKSDHNSQDYYIYGYIIISVTMIVVNCISLAFGYYASLRASRTLHSQLINRIMGAPISFFDKTPLGRITNRFSSDIQTVDQRAVFQLVHYVSFLFNVASVLVTVITVTPIVFFVAIPIGKLPLLCIYDHD